MLHKIRKYSTTLTTMGSSGGDLEVSYEPLLERVIQHEGHIAEVTKALRLCLLHHVRPVAVVFEPVKHRPLRDDTVIVSSTGGEA